MAGSMEGPIARLRRAVEHYRTLKDVFHGGVDAKRRSVRAERHRDGLEYRFRVGEIEPVPPVFSVILGEAFFNLRSALDHLVYELHVRHYGGSIPADAAGASAFPIRMRERKNKGAPIPTDRWDCIKRLGQRERTSIEWLQPYKGWDSHYPPSTQIGRLRLALADLDGLNNIDKHRQFHLVQTMAASVYRPSFLDEFGFQQHPFFGVPLISDAYIDIWTFDSPPPSEEMDMH